ncbi:MAG: sulfotransferase [Xanthomonadales bacterium]|nr:sulfotransferase [Xanthomonadales bacterium]
MNDSVQSRIDNATALLNENKFTPAYFEIKKVLRKEPQNIAALIVHAQIQLRSGKQTDSVDTINRIFEFEPASFNSALQLQLADICFENELYFLAAKLYEWVRAKKKATVLSLYRSGVSLRRLGSMRSAEQRFLECIELRPDVAATYLQMGHVYKATGHTSRAELCYKKYLGLSAEEKGTGYWSLADLKSYAFSDKEITDMQHELGLRQDNPAQLSALNFALGHAAEQRESYSEALEYYNEGNAIQARLKPFRTKQYEQIVSELQAVKGEEAQARNSEKPIPILIVGLPRSGTTLIEQILSAHSQVQATDELPFLERMALYLEMNGGYAKRLATLSEEERKLLRQQYLNGVAPYLDGETDYFIDKYPGNFLHVGLIKRFMPEAIIIDARRDPRDNAISAYRQLFGARGEFSASFDDIYTYYQGYLAMINHWHSEYPEQIKTVNYEQLVTSPDEEIAALLEICGLESEAACFEFYKQKRAVTTPSASGVTQPMYTSSIGQWRHYEEFIKDDMQRLASLIAER